VSLIFLLCSYGFPFFVSRLFFFFSGVRFFSLPLTGPFGLFFFFLDRGGRFLSSGCFFLGSHNFFSGGEAPPPRGFLFLDSPCRKDVYPSHASSSERSRSFPPAVGQVDPPLVMGSHVRNHSRGFKYFVAFFFRSPLGVGPSGGNPLSPALGAGLSLTPHPSPFTPFPFFRKTSSPPLLGTSRGLKPPARSSNFFPGPSPFCKFSVF